jgi:hypothetical protein
VARNVARNEELLAAISRDAQVRQYAVLGTDSASCADAAHTC